jgi:hypothetical protein
MKQKRIFVATRSIDDWRKLLADPIKHWRKGYSAMSTACSWERAGGLPKEIAQLFLNCDDQQLRTADLILAIPEYKVALAGGLRPSQNDVFAVLSSKSALIVMTVEAKAREEFGDNLEEWRRGTSKKGGEARLKQLLECIGLEHEPHGAIRYQLLHRAASAVLEARRFHAKFAVMLVQSFVESDSENHFADYEAFLSLYHQKAIKGRLTFLANVGNIQLLTAWVDSRVGTPHLMGDS